MPAEMLSRVFDPFVQGIGHLAGAQGGLGIGLTLVRRLVELHDGSVEAFSGGVGRGSELIVRIPIRPVRASGPDEAATASPNGPAPSPRRVLVVDDSVDSAESLAQLLRLQGHEVQTAYDGLAAVDIASTFGPEVAILDVGLPGVDGYETARRVASGRARAGRSSWPSPATAPRRTVSGRSTPASITT